MRRCLCNYGPPISVCYTEGPPHTHILTHQHETVTKNSSSRRTKASWDIQGGKLICLTLCKSPVASHSFCELWSIRSWGPHSESHICILSIQPQSWHPAPSPAWSAILTMQLHPWALTFSPVHTPILEMAPKHWRKLPRCCFLGSGSLTVTSGYLAKLWVSTEMSAP